MCLLAFVGLLPLALLFDFPTYLWGGTSSYFEGIAAALFNFAGLIVSGVFITISCLKESDLFPAL